MIMSAIIVPWGARGIVIQLCTYPGPHQLLLEGAPLSELLSLGTSFHSFRGIHTLRAESLEAFCIHEVSPDSSAALDSKSTSHAQRGEASLCVPIPCPDPAWQC